MANNATEKFSLPNGLSPTDIEENFLSLYKMQDIHDYLRLILQRFATLTIYIVEPHIEPHASGPIQLETNENYIINDYGSHIVIAAKDIFATPLFASTDFFRAIYQTLEMLLEANIEEIAILGDSRAKHFLWDMAERKKILENRIIHLINFSPLQDFVRTRDAVINYLQTHGQTLGYAPVVKPTPTV